MNKHTGFTLMACLILSICPGIITAQDEDLRARFTQAYRSYQASAGEQNWGEALPFAEQAFTLGQELYGEGTTNAAALRYNYGLNLFYVRQFEPAIQQLDQTAEAFEALGEDGVDQLVSVHMDRGRVHATTRDGTAARRAFRDALAILDELFGDDSVQYANISLQAGRMLVDIAGASEAREFLEASHEFYLAELGASDMSTAIASFYLGKHWVGQTEHRRAVPFIEAALPVLQGEPENQTLIVSALTLLARAYQGSDRAEEATPSLLAIGRIVAAEQGGQVEAEPVIVVPVVFPSRADMRILENFQTSTAVVKFDVDAAGFVRNASLESSTGAEAFGSAAVEAMNGFRFVPRMVDGNPVASLGLTREFSFELRRPGQPR